VDTNHLRPLIRLGHRFIEAKWDPSTDRYSVDVEDVVSGSKPTSTFHVLIIATGIFPSARMLEVPGIDTFRGRLLHSAKWDSAIDLRNKKVAVVGSGPSA
jgi:cation diffusion facilitator CzcD-associated flavoprotein CzcO